MPSRPQLDRTASPRHSAFPYQRPRRIRIFIVATAFIATVLAILAPRTSAQDLGEIARQERAKKQNNPPPPATHVYTNEDLRRQQILTPEDQSRFSATTQPAIVTPPKSASQLASELPSGNVYSSPSCGSCGMNLPTSARPTIQAASTTSDASSAPKQNPVDRSAAQNNISPAPAIRARTNSAPTTRANISVASATSVKSATATPTHSAPKLIPAVTAQSVAQIPEAQIAAPIPVVQIAVQNAVSNTDAPTPVAVPLDQTPLGDVARFYRLKNHLFARANPQIDPGPLNARSAPAIAKTIPNAIPSNQMPLGDIARYYRAMKREESEAIANQSSPIPAPTISASKISAPSTPPKTLAATKAPKNAYPLTLNTMSLASMKPSPTRAPKPSRSPMPLIPHASVVRSTRQATSIRVAPGDTLWQLARKYLGSAARWPELAALNPTIQNPKRLQVGAQIVVHLLA